MSVFQHQQGALHCEGVPLEAIAEAHGTPTYVYSRQAIESAFLAYRTALADRPHLICYAVKANSNLAVLHVLAGLGAGFDVVSVGELERVISAGGAADKVVFSGVGKTRQEMLSALEHGIRCFNVESESELLTLADVAAKCDKTAPVSVRVNPDVDAGTHPYISTGLRENKFGVDVETARRLYQIAHEHEALDPVGIDCHIGSQILDIAPFLESLDCLLALVDELIDQCQQAIQGLQKGCDVEDLTPDVAVNANRVQCFMLMSDLIKASGGLDVDTKFVFAQTRRDVGVGARIDIGIDPHGYRRRLVTLRCDIGQCQQLGFRFDVKTPDAVFQRRQHFLPRLADAREYDLVGRTSCGDDALQLTD